MKKALLLLSGGIDSPVAGHLIKQRGVELIALHFSLEPYTNNSAELKSVDCAKQIGIDRMIVVTIGKEEAIVRKECTHRFFYVLTRRLMLRIAEQIAHEEGCEYLVTGDALGQVGSQTLENIHVISSAVSIPILRPILAQTKDDTITIAREIGTYKMSIGPEMCGVLGPKNPATRSTTEKIAVEEEKISTKDLIASALETKREIKF